MARGPATFRQRDVTAAVRAVVAAGQEVARVEIDREGKIAIIPGTPAQPLNQDGNEWDEEFNGTYQTEVR